MTTDIHSNRSLFKMNTDFWQQARGPPLLGGQSNNLLQLQTPTNLSIPLSLTQQQPNNNNNTNNSNGNIATTNNNNNNNNIESKISPIHDQMQSPNDMHPVHPGHPGHQQQNQHPQHPHQQQMRQQQMNNMHNHTGDPSASTDMQNEHGIVGSMGPQGPNQQPTQQPQQQQHQQQSNNTQNQNLLQPVTQQAPQHPPQSTTPAADGGGENSSPEAKFNAEKLVNEIQIFMHKSAMQMQHARDMQRGGGGSVGGLGAAAMGAEVKPHQCQQCLKSFSSNHQLVQHIRVHTGEKPYKCSYCERRFKQLSHVQQHTRLHTGERPYKCHLPDCGRAFIQLSNLQQHLRNHDAQVERAKNRPFHCNICGKGFATESSLRTHTSKELQLHLGVLQQHAALIGGPNATSCPICHKLFLGAEALMEHMKHTHKDPNASGVATKRRSANHPCPVCGKHYVNEGSLRKHLACHPETSQLANSLRMWPCSVCQAVFTHEAGLLTHMEHMRMDPKHQFAAQYVLSRAAAERRERDTILAAAAAAGGSGLLPIGGGQNSMCASPSAHSDSSSGNGRLSSTGSDAGGLLNNNNNNNNCNSKLSVNDVLRASNNGHLHNQYGVEDLHANRMAVMAAAAGIVGQTGNSVTGGLCSPNESSAAVQAAVVNLAAAMRMSQQTQQPQQNQQQPQPQAQSQQQQQQQPQQPQQQQQQQNVNNGTNPTGTSSPIPNDNSQAAAAAAMNAAMRVSMADTMMRSSIGVDPMSHQQHHLQQQNSPEAALRMHQAEAILRSQAEAALRLAVSQAAAVAASNNGNDVTANSLRHHNSAYGQQNGGSIPQQQQPQTNGQQVQQQNNTAQSQNQQQQQQQPQQNPQLNSQVTADLSEALRLQEQRLEQALRLHGSDPRALGFPLHNQQHQVHNP